MTEGFNDIRKHQVFMSKYLTLDFETICCIQENN